MKSFLVYQLGYDSDSDQEYLVDNGLFVVYASDAGGDNLDVIIKANADQHWGTDWFGLAYQSWNCNDLNVEGTRIFREAAE
jgi:hypothetical protein